MRLVIFDVDGTLVDSQGAIVAAMQGAYGEIGRPVPARNTILSVVGLSLTEAFTVLAGDEPDFPVAAAADAYKRAFHDLRRRGAAHEPLFPDARRVVEMLAGRADTVLAIATGKSVRGVATMLEAHDLEGRFVSIQTADTNPSKPHPAMIVAAMAEAGVGPERTVMVGDTTFDALMARGAGARAIGVDWGYHPARDMESAGVAAMVSRFADLPDLIDRLME
jgi:phosphoglycolate phosphatase